MKPQKDELLDHDADGIQEFDNDLPRWWLYGFYFTILFGALYLVNYHVLSTPLWGERTVRSAVPWSVWGDMSFRGSAWASGMRPAGETTTSPRGS